MNPEDEVEEEDDIEKSISHNSDHDDEYFREEGDDLPNMGGHVSSLHPYEEGKESGIPLDTMASTSSFDNLDQAFCQE